MLLAAGHVLELRPLRLHPACCSKATTSPTLPQTSGLLACSSWSCSRPRSPSHIKLCIRARPWTQTSELASWFRSPMQRYYKYLQGLLTSHGQPEFPEQVTPSQWPQPCCMHCLSPWLQHCPAVDAVAIILDSFCSFWHFRYIVFTLADQIHHAWLACRGGKHCLGGNLIC